MKRPAKRARKAPKDSAEAKGAEPPSASSKAKAKAKGKAKAKASPKEQKLESKPEAKGKAKAKARGKGPKDEEASPKKVEPVAKAAGKRKDAKPSVAASAPKARKASGDGARTWAGRWIPTDPHALRKMNAIKSVWEGNLQDKFMSQSTLQSPWFKHCSDHFKAEGIGAAETSEQQFAAAAFSQVEVFLQKPEICALPP